MAKKWTPGEAGIKGLVAEVIKSWHTSLVDASIDVICQSRTPKDRPCFVSTPSAGGRARGFHLELVYSGEIFAAVEPPEMEALIDDALADWEGVEKRGRQGAPARMVYQRRQALRIHPEVLARRKTVLDKYSEVIDKVQQLELFDDDGPSKPPASYDAMTVKQLRRIRKERGLGGVAGETKELIIKQLLEADEAAVAAAPAS